MDNASKMFSGQSARRHFVTRSLQTSKITVTEIKCDIVNNGLTAPIPREDAFLITVQTMGLPKARPPGTVRSPAACPALGPRIYIQV